MWTVLEILGPNEVIAEVPFRRPARRSDPKLPRSTRIRILVIRTTMITGGESSTALVPYTGDTLSRSRLWNDLGEPELRRLAVAVCRDQDAETLWALTEANFDTYGASGARASRHTLRAYRSGCS